MVRSLYCIHLLVAGDEVSKAKAKGTAFETQILRYMQERGFADVYRPATKGAYDTGDINGIRHQHTFAHAIIQCKNQKAFDLSGWLNDTVDQAGQMEVRGPHDEGAVPILAVKRPRVGEKNLGDTYAVLRLEDLVGLLIEAGYR